MTSHNRVIRAVEEYFSTLALQSKSIDIEEPIHFGSGVGGFADVVLQANARFKVNSPIEMAMASDDP